MSTSPGHQRAPNGPRAPWPRLGIAIRLCAASAVLLTAPLAAQTWSSSYPLVISQHAGNGVCAGTIIPQPGATSLPAAIVVATNLFNASYANCVKRNTCPKPNSTVVRGAVTGYAHPFTINGVAGVEYVMTVAYECHAPPAPPDTITLRKSIVVPAGIPTPTGPFNIRVVCGPTWITTFALTSPTHLQQAIPVPQGSACTFTEVAPLPPPPPGCTWGTPTTAGPQTQGGRGTPAVVVQNTLRCVPPMESITVAKRIIGPPGVPTPVGPFLVGVVCTPHGLNTTLSLSSASHFEQAVAVPQGSSCTFTEERRLPPPPRECTWGAVSYPRGQTGRTGQTIEIVNTLRCEAPSDSVHVRKTIVGLPPGAIAPLGPFQIQVTCTPGGPNTTVALRYPSPAQLGVAVAAGTSCTFTELQPLPPAPPNCRWLAASYPGGQTGKIGGTVEVRNTLRCSTAMDSITVAKTVVGVQGVPTPTGPFHIAVACTPSGPNTTLTLQGGPAQLHEVVRFAPGSACTFNEVQPLPAPPAGCTWGTPITTGRPGGRGGETIEIKNTLHCASTGYCQTAHYVKQGSLCFSPVAIAAAMTWPNANTFCSTSILNGLAGWRLPTQLEASALSSSGLLNGQGWPLGWVWTATSNGFPATHYTIDLSTGWGAVHSTSDSFPNRVTCVR